MSNWNVLWSKTSSNSLSVKMHHKIVFNAYKKLLDPLNLKNPEIIELGCGPAGLSARLVKRYGGSATLVDKSRNALKLAFSIFKKDDLKCKILKKDLLKFNLRKRFDLVHSDGLIEHFIGEQQVKIIKIHRKYVNKNGYILICVPRPTWYYKLWKKYLQTRGKWFFGFEKALNKDDLKSILEKSGLEVIRIIEFTGQTIALAK